MAEIDCFGRKKCFGPITERGESRKAETETYFGRNFRPKPNRNSFGLTTTQEERRRTRWTISKNYFQILGNHRQMARKNVYSTEMNFLLLMAINKPSRICYSYTRSRWQKKLNLSNIYRVVTALKMFCRLSGSNAVNSLKQK